MRVVFAALSLVLLAGPALAADADATREFLAVPVEDRLAAAIDAGDHRYLGVDDSTRVVPGVSNKALPPSAVLVIPGTSGDVDPALNKSAREYAAEYNRLLIERLAKIGG
jgi:hypothetical protein